MFARRLTAALALAATTPLLTAATNDPPPTGKTIVVKMVDVSATQYTFEPSNLVVSPGDVVRFEQIAMMPHNIEFREAPAGVNLGDAKTSPMMTTPGQVFEVTIDKRFTKGMYRFVCVPHESMGMKGTLTVK